jgi:hypothetical protein
MILFFLLTLSMKMEQGVPKRRHIIEPWIHPKERIQHSEQNENLKSRTEENFPY